MCVQKYLVNYLIDERGFKYVILGQISSDPIEKTFGKYRQMSGGNYYISERQVLCSEKKLKIISLVKQWDISIMKDLSVDLSADVNVRIQLLFIIDSFYM